uniref:Uncharacterized protein n=1 Tax=Anopheles christyi TaxID=43041 RepID=A0A182KGG8_9DIPT
MVAMGGGGLVQTLRKSYSLSDLSEPDTQRTQDEVDEIVNRPQRVLRSKSSRSSSGSRQMEMYFPEVEIAGAPYHATAAPPYNYIRSSDDISSGYSSAEPGLSRTASMSNTARPRLKSKTREDEEEYGADMFYDEQDQQMFYGRGSHPIDRPLPQQRATIYELYPGGNSSLPAITQAGHTVEHGAPIYSSNTHPVAAAQPAMPAEMNDKYKLFLSWMEEQQRRESGGEPESSETTVSFKDADIEDKSQRAVMAEQSLKGEDIASVKQHENDNSNEVKEEIVSNVELVLQDAPPAVDEDFQDTISISSTENDEFLEVETADSAAEVHEQNILPTETEKDMSVPEEMLDNDVKTEATENAPNVQCDVDTELNTETTFEVQQTVEVSEVEEEKEPNQIIIEVQNEDTMNQLEETSNLLVASSSNSNLTSSSSSLAVSEGSTGSVINLATESGAQSVPPKKHPSFGKQRKAPPVPPPPEMIVVRERPSKPSTPTAPIQTAPKAVPSSVEKKTVPTKPTASARNSSPAGTTGAPSSGVPEKTKPKKFMSSLTGMFKGQTTATSEKMSASCTTLPRTKKPEKTTKTRSKTEKPSV